MIVRISQLGDLPYKLDFKLNRKDCTRLEDRITFDAFDCQAILIIAKEKITLKGAYQGKLEIPCDLCTEPSFQVIDQDFELVLLPAESMGPADKADHEISLVGDDVDYYEGNNLNLGQYFTDQLLLDLPWTVHCREDCKGLCSKCGGNLNNDGCACSDYPEDNPFRVLKDLT